MSDMEVKNSGVESIAPDLFEIQPLTNNQTRNVDESKAELNCSDSNILSGDITCKGAINTNEKSVEQAAGDIDNNNQIITHTDSEVKSLPEEIIKQDVNVDDKKDARSASQLLNGINEKDFKSQKNINIDLINENQRQKESDNVKITEMSDNKISPVLAKEIEKEEPEMSVPTNIVTESVIENMSEIIESERDNEKVNESQSTDAENFVDILGNGLLTKRIISHGLGRETRPTHGDSVTIQYKGWNSSDELFDSNDVSFVLGDGDMIQAFDLVICLAERHEEFEMKTDARFAYGTYGWESKVKPNELLTYHIKLLRVDDPPEYGTFSHKDRMQAADAKRERGNYLYRREEYSLAINSYSRAVKIIETDPDYKKASNDPSKADMYDLFVKVTNNLAAAQLKLESYDNVIETCDTILNYDASNVKALFRKGKSLTMKGNYDEAIPILKRALELENSKLIAGEIQRCYQLKRAEDEQRARVCRKMFSSGMKDSTEKCQKAITPRWKSAIYKYSPYIGAVFITGISVMLASIAIAKSKGN